MPPGGINVRPLGENWKIGIKHKDPYKLDYCIYIYVFMVKECNSAVILIILLPKLIV